MDGDIPHIDVRTVQLSDVPALHTLDYSFETDRIYTLQVQGRLAAGDAAAGVPGRPVLAFELLETPLDPPLYKSYQEFAGDQAEVEARLSYSQGGYIALADGEAAGVILLNEDDHRVARIENIIVDRHYRRYGIGSLLLSCASDWARRRGCRAMLLETQNVNYPAIQFYLRNGLEVWSINLNFYPPGPCEHEVAIFMGKKLWSAP
jgi:ribosomal protein S18 acetylase RimI-like enzyme